MATAVPFASAGYVCPTATVAVTINVQGELTGVIVEDPQPSGSICGSAGGTAVVSMVRGDKKAFTVTFTEADGSTPIDLTDTVIKFAMRKKAGKKNSDALVFLTSYSDNCDQEVEIIDAVNGVALLHIQPHYTDCIKDGDYIFGIEYTKRDVSLTTAGTVDVAEGSEIITGTGLDLECVGRGDMLVTGSASSENQELVTITAIGGDGTDLDPGAGNLRTDYTGWSDETGLSVTIYEGDRKSPNGLRGTWTLLPGAVQMQ